MAATSTLKDDFETGFIDTGYWSYGGDSAQVTEPSQYLHITHAATSEYNSLYSTSTYDLTGSSFFVQIKDAGNQSLTSHEVILKAQVDANNAVWFTISGNNLSAYKKVASVQTQIGSSVAYSSTNHAWLRIREASGTIHFDTSTDGSSWTNDAWTLANPFAITAVYMYLQSGCWQNEASGSYGDFDNFNLTTGERQITWCGYVWNKRGQTGASMYNNQWLTSNVTGPDANGYLTLSISNAGSSPYGAEIFSAQRGFGYGQYTCVWGTRSNNLYRSIVVGGMYTFDYTRPPDYAEIDMGEIRDYNSNTNIRLLFNHAWNNGGSIAWVTDDVDMSSDSTFTSVCTWTPDKIAFRTFAGDGTGGTLINSSSQDSHLPVPGYERVHFNLWVQNISTPASTTATDIVLRKFSFDKFKEPGNRYRHVSVGNGMSRSEGAT